MMATDFPTASAALAPKTAAHQAQERVRLDAGPEPQDAQVGLCPVGDLDGHKQQQRPSTAWHFDPGRVNVNDVTHPFRHRDRRDPQSMCPAAPSEYQRVGKISLPRSSHWSLPVQILRDARAVLAKRVREQPDATLRLGEVVIARD